MRFRAEVKIKSSELDENSLPSAKLQCIDLLIDEVKKAFPNLKDDDIIKRVENGVEFDTYNTANSMISIHDHINARASLDGEPMCYIMAEVYFEDIEQEAR